MTDAFVLASIALGGALGAVLRYLVTLWTKHQSERLRLPLGTTVVNIAGSTVLGFLAGWVAVGGAPGATAPAVTAGFFGALTTFSTFIFEAVGMVQHGRGTAAAGYVVLQVAGCVAGAAAGLWLAAL